MDIKRTEDKYIVECGDYLMMYTERVHNITMQIDILADPCFQIPHATKFDTKEEAEHVSNIALYNPQDEDKPRKVWQIKEYIEHQRKIAEKNANAILKKTFEDKEQKQAAIDQMKEAGRTDEEIDEWFKSLDEGE